MALFMRQKKTLEEAGDKIAEEERSAIQEAITQTEEALKSGDKEQIETKTKELTEVSSSLAQKMYTEPETSDGAAQKDSDSNQSGEAVDAEFEEVKDEKNDK
jgi:molecular chaperone DnaK